MVQMFLTVFNSNWYTIFFFFFNQSFFKKDNLVKELFQGEVDHDKELSHREGNRDQELSKGIRAMTISFSKGQMNVEKSCPNGNTTTSKCRPRGKMIWDIWDTPLGMVNDEEAHISPKEVPRCPRGSRRGISDLHSTSPAPAGPTHTKLAAATLLEVLRKRVCQGGKGSSFFYLQQVTAAGAQSHLAALHSPCPCCPHSPSSPQLETQDLSKQWAFYKKWLSHFRGKLWALYSLLQWLCMVGWLEDLQFFSMSTVICLLAASALFLSPFLYPKSKDSPSQTCKSQIFTAVCERDYFFTLLLNPRFFLLSLFAHIRM